MIRVMQHKYTSHDGTEYDSREECLYHQLLKSDANVSCIHRQVKLNIFPSVYIRVPKRLKTKIRYDKRLLISGHGYKPDFIFFEGDRIVVCDVKSKYTHSLREFRITAKGAIQKIFAHNRKRHDGNPVVIFREAIHIRKDEWKIIDYPPLGCMVIPLGQ